MLYDKLNPTMQEMIDVYVRRLGVLTWQRRSEILVEAAPSFGIELPPDKARTAARGFITAVLERLGDEPVDDPFQASLYLVSLNQDHQDAAAVYLEEHPEVRVAMDEILDPPGSGN
jgi:hypothetical protein